jgi:hypothetical protein
VLKYNEAERYPPLPEVAYLRFLQQAVGINLRLVETLRVVFLQKAQESY